MDKKAEVFNPEKDSSVKTINLDSGEKAKVYKNYLILADNTVVRITDPSNPQNPKYDPNIIYFSQKNMAGAKFGSTPTGSWIQIQDPSETESILKTIDSQN
jgi:hypothetical protein